MASRKISTLPDVATSGDVIGTQVTAFDDLVATKTKQVTLAVLRRGLFAGGTGYTATDPLQAGNTNITGTLAVSGAVSFAGAVTAASFAGPLTGNVTGNLSGNAATATLAAAAMVLANARTINGVFFDGSADITVAAAAGTLTGTTLAAGVTASSLTSLGTLTGLTVSGVVQFAAGSASLPSLTTTGDLNTGLFFPAADKVGISTDGTLRAITGLGFSVGTTTDLGVGNIAIPAGGYLGFSATAYITPEDNVQGARVKTGGGFIVETGGSERARITSGGYLKASNDGTYVGATGTYHELRNNTSLICYATNTATVGPNGFAIEFSAASPNNTTNYFINCADSTNQKLVAWSNGDVQNRTGVYGTISDAKLKQDITDAPSQWDDLKAIRFRKYRFISDVEAKGEDAPHLLGVVAQELQKTSPGLVDAHPDMESVEVVGEDGETRTEQRPTGTETLSVKQSVLLMKAAVALQEAIHRIEAQDARLTKLEARRAA